MSKILNRFMCKAFYFYLIFNLTSTFSSLKWFTFVDCSSDNVKVLNDLTFDKFVSENKLVMVKFYADWCVHCKNLAPEYSKASNMLKDEKSPVVFAKVKNEDGEKLMEKHSVRGFPTLLFFKNGEQLEYTGHRDAAGLVSWVKEMSVPGVTYVEDLSTLPTNETYFVAFTKSTFSDLDKGTVSDLFRTYVRVSDRYRQFTNFYVVDVSKRDPSSWNKWREYPEWKEWKEWKEFSKKKKEWSEVVESLSKKELEWKDKVTEEDFVVYHQYEGYTRFEGSTTEELEQFLATETIELFSEIYQDRYMFYLSSGLDLGWFCGSKEDFEKYKDVFTKAARALRHSSAFVWIDSDRFGPLKDAFVFKELPALAYQTSKGRYLLQPKTRVGYKKYSFKTFKDLLHFYHDVKHGLVPKSVRSEEEPKDNSGPVKVVVGNTLKKLFTHKKNVLLMIHEPHCQLCESFLPVYEEFAASNKDNESLIFASFNGDANESSVEEVEWEAFPTLLYFKAGERVPVKFSGERTTQGLREFVVQNGGLVSDVPHTEL